MTSSARDVSVGNVSGSLAIGSEQPKKVKSVLGNFVSDKMTVMSLDNSYVDETSALSQPSVYCESVAETCEPTKRKIYLTNFRLRSAETLLNDDPRKYSSLPSFGYDDCYENGYDALYNMALYSPTGSVQSELSMPSPSSPAELSDDNFSECSPCSVNDECYTFVRSTYDDKIVCATTSNRTVRDEEDVEHVTIEETQMEPTRSDESQQLAEADDHEMRSGDDCRPVLSECRLPSTATSSLSAEAVSTRFATVSQLSSLTGSFFDFSDTISCKSILRPVQCPPSRDLVLKDVICRPHLTQSKLDAFFTDPEDVPSRMYASFLFLFIYFTLSAE
jgi:hypothetical protein